MTDNENNCENHLQCTPSIERQVRITAGSLVLVGIALAYAIFPPFIWLSIVVSLGMIVSGVTNSCALGSVIAKLPWNQNS